MENKLEILLAGASGLIGTALTKALIDDGHRPIRLVRRPAKGEDEIMWDPKNGVMDIESFDGVDAVVNLSGAGIGDKRWTDDYKKLLLSSRTRTTSLLATTLAELPSPPKTFLSGSAIGIYGDRDDEVLSEDSEIGSTFLAGLCQKWETAAQPAIDAGIRTAFLRTGIVQTPKGGALKKMLPLFKFGLGGKFGSGKQYMSWITMTDEVNAIKYLLTNDVSGPVNLTAPNPVTNETFVETLGQVLSRPTLLPVPTFGPRLLLGSEMADALLFESTRILPMALTDHGFRFEHSELEAGLRAEILGG